MVLIVGDDVGWHCQSPWTTSRYGNLTKNTQKIRKTSEKNTNGVENVMHWFQYSFKALCIYIYIQKGKSHLVWPKLKKNNISRILCHGCIQWNVGMMVTWPIIKMVYIKVKAQSCIELYSIVLPRYDVKDFSHYLFFFNLLHSSPWKQHERMGFSHILKTKTRGYNCCIMGKLTQKGKCILLNRKKHWNELEETPENP